jgi:hypothetical protein
MYSKNTHKGRYRVSNPAKYAGDPTQVVYRSLWELKFMKWCDTNDSVLQWGSEEIVIPYLSPVDGRIHRYFVDFYIKVKDRDGSVRRYLIEIKPHKFTQPPERPKRVTPRYINEVMSFGVNQAKWKNATDFCENQGWKFLVLTEHDLGIDK